MRLKIHHRTEYGYDAPLSYGLQRLRLTPGLQRAFVASVLNCVWPMPDPRHRGNTSSWP